MLRAPWDRAKSPKTSAPLTLGEDDNAVLPDNEPGTHHGELEPTHDWEYERDCSWLLGLSTSPLTQSQSNFRDPFPFPWLSGYSSVNLDPSPWNIARFTAGTDSGESITGYHLNALSCNWQRGGSQENVQTNHEMSRCTLWTRAYEKLPDEYKKDLDNRNNPEVLQQLLETIKEAQMKCTERQWSIPWGGKQINVREKAEKLLDWITKFRDIGDIAVQYDPAHADLPWAAVRFILTLFTGEPELLAAAIVGMERIALWIGRCAIYEQLFFSNGSDIPEVNRRALDGLSKALLALYTTILQVLRRLIKIFNVGNTYQNLHSIAMFANVIGKLDHAESTVISKVRLVEYYWSRTINNSNIPHHAQNPVEFGKLRILLADFSPALSLLKERTKETCKDSEDDKRVRILNWLSAIR